MLNYMISHQSSLIKTQLYKNPHLYQFHLFHVHSMFFKSTDYFGCPFESRIAGTKIDGQQISGIAVEKLVYSVHILLFLSVTVLCEYRVGADAGYFLSSSRKCLSLSTSFNPGFVSKRLFRSKPANCGWRNSFSVGGLYGLMPPLSRKGFFPLQLFNMLQSN